jgi:hypothetical protein
LLAAAVTAYQINKALSLESDANHDINYLAAHLGYGWLDVSCKKAEAACQAHAMASCIVLRTAGTHVLQHGVAGYCTCKAWALVSHIYGVK